MASSETTEEILSAWRASVEADQEVGAVSSLSLGESDSLIDALPGLTACRYFALTRTDLSAPWILAGGGSALWYCLAVHFATGTTSSQSALDTVSQPVLTPFYAGADSATVMASHSLQDGSLYTQRMGSAKADLDDLPGGITSRLEPAIQFGGVDPWESLPFSIMEPGSTSIKGGPADWSAYAALFLAVCLILVALVIQ